MPKVLRKKEFAMDDQITVFRDDDERKDRLFVNALARGLDILRCFRAGETYLANAELASRTGIPKPTVSRFTHTLTKLGYLLLSESDGKYRLASGVLALGYSMLANMDVREIARPAMRELAEYSKGAVSIGIRDRLSMVYVESCRSSSRVALQLAVGSRIPLATTAIGRAVLAGLPQEERDYLLDHIRLADEENWPRIKFGIEQAQRDIVERGFCLSVGELHSEIHAVGVPLIGVEQEKALAFNCGGPAFLLPREKLESDIGPRLVQLVRKVATDMGSV
jgi:DNA-binding IclR family transcriptional regulator